MILGIIFGLMLLAILIWMIYSIIHNMKKQDELDSKIQEERIGFRRAQLKTLHKIK